MTTRRTALVLMVVAVAMLALVCAGAKPAVKKGAKQSADARLAQMPAAEREALAAEKLAIFQSFAQSSSDGVVIMNATGYDALIKRAPRNYHVMLAFTVLQKKRDCKPCTTLHEIMQEVGRGMLRGIKSGEYKHDIFFAVVDYDSGGVADIFTRADVKYTPLFAYIGPSMTTSLGDKPYRDDDVFDLTRYALATESVVQFITMRTGVEIDTATPLPLLQILLVTVLVVGAGYMLQDIIERIVPFKLIFFVAFVAVSALCLGGLPFYYIRKTPWSSPSEKGLSAYIAPAQRHQYGLESLIVGGLGVACSAALGLVAVWVPARDRFAFVPGSRRCAVVFDWLNLMTPFVGVALCLAFMVGVICLGTLNNAKMGSGYPFSLLSLKSLFEWSHFGKFSSF